MKSIGVAEHERCAEIGNIRVQLCLTLNVSYIEDTWKAAIVHIIGVIPQTILAGEVVESCF